MKRVRSFLLLSSIPEEKLLYWQRCCLFIAVAMIPLVGPPVLTKYLAPLFFYGQPASVPILVGLFLAAIMVIREGNARKVLFPILCFSSVYLILIAAISIHSIANFDGWRPDVFGASMRVDAIKALLLQMGIEESWAYRGIVFVKDLRNGVHETVFILCFVLWIGLLYKRNSKKIFTLIQNAIIVDFFLLGLYCSIEVIHLYDVNWATSFLKAVNPSFYVPGGALGWYPPIVSATQIRGIWTEPAYFAIWLAFASPFLFHRLFNWQSTKGTVISSICQVGVLFSLFSIWFMTYSRTSIWLMLVMGALYFIAMFLFWNSFRRIRLQVTKILGSCLLAFMVVSNFGPADISNWNSSSLNAREQLTHTVSSQLSSNTVRSSFDPMSRSTPSRLQFWIARVEIFKDSPIFGVGDSLEPWYDVKKYHEFWGDEITSELKWRSSWAKKNGLLNAGFGGNNLLLWSMLACRGIIGTLVFAIPLLCVFYFLARITYLQKDRDKHPEALCILVSVFACSPSALTQGLWFFDIWPAIGLAIGYVYLNKELLLFGKRYEQRYD